jgi:hypothetical protein
MSKLIGVGVREKPEGAERILGLVDAEESNHPRPPC